MASFAAFLVLCCLLPATILGDATPLAAISESNMKFARDFYKAVVQSDVNLVTSPTSAQIALATLQFGARGDTASQMSTALHLPQDRTTVSSGFKQLYNSLTAENSGETLRIANRMFYQQKFTLKPAFVAEVQETFQQQPAEVDFRSKPQAVRTINSWVESVTENRITDLVQEDDLNENTEVIVVNALYFNGEWKHKFNPGFTFDKYFYTGEETKISTKFMRLEEFVNFVSIDRLQAKLIELPYESDQNSLVLLVPDSRTGLAALEGRMETEDLSALVTSAVNTEIRLFVPKFQIESTLFLNQPLRQMGMVKMFTTSADFSAISSDEKLYITSVLQKTFIRVSENGTEAVAATRGIAESRSGRDNPPPYIVVEHPFLFFLLHRSSENRRVVLFSGRVVEPKNE